MPDFTIKGDPGGIRSRAATMAKKADLFSDTGSALRDLDGADGWYGRPADRFRDKHNQEPKNWWEAGGAFRRGGSALSAYADVLEHAQNEAKRAKQEYERGEDATREAKAAYSDYTSRFERAKSAALASGLTYPYPKDPYTDPGEEIRSNALEILAAAKRSRTDAANVCAGEVRAACRNAPEKRNWFENIVHQSGAVLGGAAEAVWDLVEMGMSKYNPTWQMNMAILAKLGIIEGNGLTTEESDMRFELDREMLTEAWKAAKKDPVAFGEELGKSILDWDTWADDPARAVGHLLPDIVAAILTGGTAAAASRGLRVGADIADSVGDMGRAASGLNRAADVVDNVGSKLNVTEKIFGSPPPVRTPDLDAPAARGVESPSAPSAPPTPSTPSTPSAPPTPPTPDAPSGTSPNAPEVESTLSQTAGGREGQAVHTPESSSPDTSQTGVGERASDGPASDGPASESPASDLPSRGASPDPGTDSPTRGSTTEPAPAPVGRGSVPDSPDGVAPEPTRAASTDPTPTPVRTRPRDLSSYELPSQPAHHSAGSPSPSAPPGSGNMMAHLESRLGGHADAPTPTSAAHHSPDAPAPGARNVVDEQSLTGQPAAPDHIGAHEAAGTPDTVDTVEQDISHHEPATGHDTITERPEPRSRDDYPGLNRYTADGYEAMNARLRGLTEDLELSTDPTTIAELDRLIELTSQELKDFPEHVGSTYRGTRLPDDVLARITEGGTFKDDAFLSTSKKSQAAELFQNIGNGEGTKVRFEIDGHSGRDLTSVFAKEGEVLFDRGTNFDVLSRSWNDAAGCWDIKLREADPDISVPDADAATPHFDSEESLGSAFEDPPGAVEDGLGHRTTDGGWFNEATGVRLAPEQNAAADAFLDKAARSEPRITADIQTIAKLSGADNEGIEFRLKSEDSFKRKLFTDLLQVDDLETSLSSMKDAVRYTLIHGDSNYSDSVESARQMMQDRGYESVELKNTWGSSGYQGVNSVWKSSDGQLFELQHHTPSSFEAKMSTHAMYEEQRLPGTSPARVHELEGLQREIFGRVHVPDGSESIYARDPELPAPDHAADRKAFLSDRLGGSLDPSESPGSGSRSGFVGDSDEISNDPSAVRDSSIPGEVASPTPPAERYVHPGEDAVAQYRDAVDLHGHSNPDGWIGSANPHLGSGEPRWTQNCGSNARSFADTFQGNAAMPPLGDGRIPPSEVNEMWTELGISEPPSLSNHGGEVTAADFTADTYGKVELVLQRQPPGTTAVIGVDWDIPGKDIGTGGGHWFNAYVDDSGSVRWADQQTGQVSDWPPRYTDNIWKLDLAVRSDGASPWRGMDLA